MILGTRPGMSLSSPVAARAKCTPTLFFVDAEVARMQRASGKYRDAGGRGTFKSLCLSLLQGRDSQTFPNLIQWFHSVDFGVGNMSSGWVADGRLLGFDFGDWSFLVGGFAAVGCLLIVLV
jgi:hypothetical protein